MHRELELTGAEFKSHFIYQGKLGKLLNLPILITCFLSNGFSTMSLKTVLLSEILSEHFFIHILSGFSLPMAFQHSILSPVALVCPLCQGKSSQSPSASLFVTLPLLPFVVHFILCFHGWWLYSTFVVSQAHQSLHLHVSQIYKKCLNSRIP